MTSIVGHGLQVGGVNSISVPLDSHSWKEGGAITPLVQSVWLGDGVSHDSVISSGFEETSVGMSSDVLPSDLLDGSLGVDCLWSDMVEKTSLLHIVSLGERQVHVHGKDGG